MRETDFGEEVPMLGIGRREFISLFGGAVAWPLAAHAQQPPPIVGLVTGRSADASPRDVGAFRKGLNETRLLRRPERCDRISVGGGTTGSGAVGTAEKCQQRSLPPFAKRTIWNAGNQSTEMPAALMSGPHFAISRSTSICKYSGERPSALTSVAPSSCTRPLHGVVLARPPAIHTSGHTPFLRLRMRSSRWRVREK